MIDDSVGFSRKKERGEFKDGNRSRGRKYIYIYSYDWFILLYGRNHHNIVKAANLQFKKKKERGIALYSNRDIFSVILKEGRAANLKKS